MAVQQTKPGLRARIGNQEQQSSIAVQVSTNLRETQHA
jgi:hypothetical protein